MGRPEREPQAESAQPPESGGHDRAEQPALRLARIRQLWGELRETEPGSLRHQTLTDRIRLESEAYNKAVDDRDPNP
jgi:hypothetical protein